MSTGDIDGAALRAASIDSRAGFVAALLDVARQALERRARRMVWVDADFAAWPLDDPALLHCLTDWLRLPRRQLMLLARDYDKLAREKTRFAAWYRSWSHAVSAFAPEPDDALEVPCVLLAENTAMVHLADPERWRGWASDARGDLRQWRERLDVLLQRMQPAFPATTLGL